MTSWHQYVCYVPLVKVAEWVEYSLLMQEVMEQLPRFQVRPKTRAVRVCKKINDIQPQVTCLLFVLGEVSGALAYSMLQICSTVWALPKVILGTDVELHNFTKSQKVQYGIQDGHHLMAIL